MFEAVCMAQLQGTKIFILVLFFSVIEGKNKEVAYILKAYKTF